jgi:uncharacterized protein (TIGR02646 family)
MQECRRGAAPELLAQHGPEIGAEYACRRREDPNFRFRWPQRGGQKLYDIARAALAAMTAQRCSYCDGYPLNATGKDEIDHFRPKTHEDFYELVCAWENLFLVCTSCNRAKRDQWESSLLRPDDPEYSFDRYFLFNFETGELKPAPDIAAPERHRVQRTIEILDLNRPGACTARLTAIKVIRRRESDDELADLAYRFLVPLVAS